MRARGCDMLFTPLAKDLHRTTVSADPITLELDCDMYGYNLRPIARRQTTLRVSPGGNTAITAQLWACSKKKWMRRQERNMQQALGTQDTIENLVVMLFASHHVRNRIRSRDLPRLNRSRVLV